MSKDFDNDSKDIDYLHPDGKPDGVVLIEEINSSKPDLRSYLKAIAEADGHSMKRNDPFLHTDKPCKEKLVHAVKCKTDDSNE